MNASLSALQESRAAVLSSSYTNEANACGVSWPAILAGALVAAAMALVLLALGAGLGLSSISPWTNEGVERTTIGAAAIVWLILMQLISSALGGYIVGRLRTKWVNVHTDEVFFRDTAHGFLVWAVGVVITAALLASASSTLVGAGAKALGHVAGAGSMAAMESASSATKASSDGNIESSQRSYFVDLLFRTDHPSAEANDMATRAEATTILATALRNGGDISPADNTYLAQIVSAKTGLSASDAQARVNTTVNAYKDAKSRTETAVRETADAARKAAAHTSLWIFISLLIGAFTATFTATVGGRLRDHLPA